MLLHVAVAHGRTRERTRWSRLLGALDAVVTPVSTSRELMKLLTREDFDLVVVGAALLPSPPQSLLETIRNLPDRPEIIVTVEEEDPGRRAALLGAGCLAVIFEGLPDPTLAETLSTLVRRQQSERLQLLRGQRPEEAYSLNDFISLSPSMRRFLAVARRVTEGDSSLLIQGETGVGKERLARGIHRESPRSGGPFLALNCAALPETLLESELFGHEEGAFTGATRARRGYFELAHGGTLFLDEIGEVAIHLQAKLLRALERHEIQRVGGERTVTVNVRIVAATNRNLEAEVAAGNFRADLFYRLVVVSLTVPPLRERREDIPTLAESYLELYRARLGRGAHRISPEAMDALVAYAWPGNVRELINVVERAVLLSTGDTIGLEDLPPAIAGAPSPAGVAPGTSSGQSPWPKNWFELPLSRARELAQESLDRLYLERVLETTRGRVGDAAVEAGISPRALYALMRRYGLAKEQFRRPARVRSPEPRPGPPDAD